MDCEGSIGVEVSFIEAYAAPFMPKMVEAALLKNRANTEEALSRTGFAGYTSVEPRSCMDLTCLARARLTF